MSSKESENSAALRVLNLRKTYKAAAAPALDGVTFEVGQGESACSAPTAPASQP